MLTMIPLLNSDLISMFAGRLTASDNVRIVMGEDDGLRLLRCDNPFVQLRLAWGTDPDDILVLFPETVPLRRPEVRLLSCLSRPLRSP